MGQIPWTSHSEWQLTSLLFPPYKASALVWGTERQVDCFFPLWQPLHLYRDPTYWSRLSLKFSGECKVRSTNDWATQWLHLCSGYCFGISSKQPSSLLELLPRTYLFQKALHYQQFKHLKQNIEITSREKNYWKMASVHFEIYHLENKQLSNLLSVF